MTDLISRPRRPTCTCIPTPDLRAALTEGRQAARSDHGVELGWIFDIPGERGLAAADVTLDFLRDHAPEGTVALGLAGMENGVPRAKFADHFAQARALGLKAVVHAGETTGPDTVWSALRDLKADRVGHGMFDTDLDREYRLITDLAGLDVAGVCDLARAGVAASYAPDSLRKDLTDRIADIGSTPDAGYP
ncbi:aminodeoxyfutalosine deaminase [Actinokineospora alba]|uniref:Aminodeoxyfutalosine deaminase n=1 Tax=Actinokineospora alba TaxID=504798 RepID=A0A1H0U011_9PSEU|nr:hypothetical protein [Actinokineospora alba]SDJ17520.1 aminodeoxyfutalosine deaminase [Actinokineospora alba]SDP59652.1 aminodeoxyfutalosine deaminase [Actinokineospora alba]